jgi:hypothetical protein
MPIPQELNAVVEWASCPLEAQHRYDGVQGNAVSLPKIIL